MTDPGGYPFDPAEYDLVLEALENLLGYMFDRRELLLQALCHKSYINEHGLPLIEANERLEFLGDSVVELAVTHMLYEEFPQYHEGDLTKLRAPLVRGVALAEVARRMGLGEYMLLGKGEENTGGRGKRSLLAGTFEAVVGALYLDAGFDTARGMVISLLEPVIHDVIKWGSGDYKSELQEAAAKRLGRTPRYRVRQEGPDHYRTFHVTVEVGEHRFGPVPGSSKKEAEQGAARVALLTLGWAEEQPGDSGIQMKQPGG